LVSVGIAATSFIVPWFISDANASPPVIGGALTAAGLANAILPAGTCGNPKPIQLSNGFGQLGTDNPFPSADYVGDRIVGNPVSVNFGGKGHAGLAAIMSCSEGGSDEFSFVWVFTGSPDKLKVLFGPLTPRTYDVTSSVYGPQVISLRASGHTLVVGEMFSRPGDECGSCGTGRASTTWSLSPSNSSQLVITRPRPTRVRIVKSVSPTAAPDGGTPTANQRGPRLIRGKTALALCTVGAGSTSPKTQLDTGAWVPSGDLASPRLPDCDKIATTIAAPTTAAPTTTSTSSTTTTTITPTITPTTTANAAGSPPCTVAALTAAVQAAGDPNETGVDPGGYVCSGDWAVAGVELGSGGDASEGTRIFMAVNGSWQQTVVQLDCLGGSSSPTLPPLIFQRACNSN
jgi:hypothetical protein